MTYRTYSCEWQERLSGLSRSEENTRAYNRRLIKDNALLRG